MTKKDVALSFKDILESVVIAIILALIIRTFFFQFFWIPSRSMESTLLINDRIIVTRFSYWFHEPQRSDVVVFKVNPEFAKILLRIRGFFKDTT